MLLSELLTPTAVTTRLKAVTKRDAVAELVGVLEAGHGSTVAERSSTGCCAGRP